MIFKSYTIILRRLILYIIKKSEFIVRGLNDQKPYKQSIEQKSYYEVNMIWRNKLWL